MHRLCSAGTSSEIGRVGIYCRTIAKQIREVVMNNDIWFIHSSLCPTVGVTTTMQRYHLQLSQRQTLEGKRPLGLTMCLVVLVFEKEFLRKSRTVDWFSVDLYIGVAAVCWCYFGVTAIKISFASINDHAPPWNQHISNAEHTLTPGWKIKFNNIRSGKLKR